MRAGKPAFEGVAGKPHLPAGQRPRYALAQQWVRSCRSDLAQRGQRLRHRLACWPPADPQHVAVIATLKLDEELPALGHPSRSDIERSSKSTLRFAHRNVDHGGLEAARRTYDHGID